MSEEFYQFKIDQLNGKEIAMSDFKGKAILIVNTASKCGYTYQYKGLEKLYKDYKDSDLVVIGFPCDQFGNQEPGNSDRNTVFSVMIITTSLFRCLKRLKLMDQMQIHSLQISKTKTKRCIKQQHQMELY